MLTVSGCRGIVGESLTPPVITRYAEAFARFVMDESGARTPTVVLARDGRAGGAPIASLAASALALNGVRVIDIGVAMTPTAGHAVVSRKADAGLVVTASHNPAQWNGLKSIDSTGAALAPEKAAQFIDLFHENARPEGKSPGVTDIAFAPGATSEHVADVVAALREPGPIDAIREAKFRVVVDSVNASGAEAVRLLAKELGFQLVHLNDSDSGVFPHTPEPTAENLTGLCEALREKEGDVGFAQDPDADRLAIVDEKGAYIGEEYTLALCARSLLETMDASEACTSVLVANLSTSRMIEDVAAAYGASVERSSVGEANVVKLMRARGACIGGEGNGGVIWPRVVSIRDSIGSMALVLRLMASTGKTVSQLVKESPAYAIVKRKTPIREGLADVAMERTRTLIEGADIDTQDGVRLDFDTDSGGRGWLHVRPSNTEPILRLIAEAPSEAEANAILDRAGEAISGV